MFVGMHCGKTVEGESSQMGGIAVDGDITDEIYGDLDGVCGP